MITAISSHAVVGTAQAMFDAMRDKVIATLRSLFTPDTLLMSIDERENSPAPKVLPTEDFLVFVSNSSAPLREVMRDPQAMIDGKIAMLWAPYTFHIGEQFSHCGHDLLLFANIDGAWKITAISFPMRTVDCVTRPSAEQRHRP